MSNDDHIIINNPYKEPRQHWLLDRSGPSKIAEGRRESRYGLGGENSGFEEITLVNQIRPLVKKWREEAMRGGGGVTRTTMELLNYWHRKGRRHPLFFAQLEAAETVIFLAEARPDYRQGIRIPLDELGESARRAGHKEFVRWCCKLATGGGKTTVMGMLAAWSILNKIDAHRDSRYSDAVLVICPNVTIRERLGELDPHRGGSSIYRSRDLVPPDKMPLLSQGKVLAINWHVFDLQSASAERVVKTGKRMAVTRTIRIGDKDQSARGKKYMTMESFLEKERIGLFKVLSKKTDKTGALVSAVIEDEKYVETDNAMVKRVLGREFGDKRNILVMNDEAHHAYRIREDIDGGDVLDDDEFFREYCREATVWVEGLDRIHKSRGICRCFDFSATPYFLGGAGKENLGKIFPWTVSDFGLSDAIESGLVKVPQFSVRMNGDRSSYYDLWNWILPKLTSRERGGKRSDVKPEAVLKHAHAPLTLMLQDWERTRKKWEKDGEIRPPVLIIVCKNIKLAKVVYEWITGEMDGDEPTPSEITSLHNTNDRPDNTIRVDSKVSDEIESGNAKKDDVKWMRFVLDTVGKAAWPKDDQGRSIYPPEFEKLADKMNRSKKYPPGRNVRCVVSVSMLTEGWDCSTVTHIVGLRPFMSQLLCEQVVGRGLRRANYIIDDASGMFGEEISTVYGVPFDVPSKGIVKQKIVPVREQSRIHAMKERGEYALSFPRVDGYRNEIRRRLDANFSAIPEVTIDGSEIPNKDFVSPDIMDAAFPRTPHGPGKQRELNLDEFRRSMRLQKGQFLLAANLSRHLDNDKECCIPPAQRFWQIFLIVRRYFKEKVKVNHHCHIADAFLSPRYPRIRVDLINSIRPGEGECPEVPRYDSRESGDTGEIDFITRREIFPVEKSHVNAVAMDSKMEGRAADLLNRHPRVKSFVKNEGLEFYIPYMADDGAHDYRPDFIVRLLNGMNLILETKGYDDSNVDQKSAGAIRWVDAVNADRRHGRWHYKLVRNTEQIPKIIDKLNGE